MIEKSAWRRWKPEEVSALEAAVAKGWTQEAIAAQLESDFGLKVTASAVAGHIDRRGLKLARNRKHTQ